MEEKPAKAVKRSSLERNKTWASFGDRLHKVLRRLEEDHALVVREKGTNRYVQFLGQGAGGLRVEAVSNAYLPPRDKLTAAQIRMLAGLGWRSPTGTPIQATPDKQPEGSPNFMRQFPRPVDAKEAAALAVATLADIMRIPHPGFLCYESMNVDTGGSLTWNDLEIKRAEPEGTLADTARQLLLTLRAETGNETLDFDENGDVALRFGSAAVCVRVVGDLPAVRIHAPLLRDVRNSPKLLERLNELTARIVRPALFHASNCVFAVADIPATPFEARHVVRALREICSLADGIDELLQGEFGGQTAFADTMLSSKVH